MELLGDWKRCAIGPVMRWRGEPDHVMECQVCSALVTEDGEAMQRHVNWHRRSQSF